MHDTRNFKLRPLILDVLHENPIEAVGSEFQRLTWQFLTAFKIRSEVRGLNSPK